MNWSSFLKRSFQIIDHELDPDVVILIDEEYLRVIFHDTKPLFSSHLNLRELQIL